MMVFVMSFDAAQEAGDDDSRGMFERRVWCRQQVLAKQVALYNDAHLHVQVLCMPLQRGAVVGKCRWRRWCR